MKTSTLFRSLLCAALLGLGAAPTHAQSATMIVPGMGQVIAGDGAKQALKCGNDAVTISGSGTQIVVNGDRNVIVAATVGQIVVNGRANTVSWQKAMKGTRPMQRVTGSGNKVVKR
jgi:Protein of unknown function (DUF3060)